MQLIQVNERTAQRRREQGVLSPKKAIVLRASRGGTAGR